MEAATKIENVVWAPQPGSQELFLSCPYFEVLYEGTRGPGKTDALLMDFAQHVGQGFGPAWQGVLFREEYKELADVVKKSKKWFKQIFRKARFLESKADYKWIFPWGEELLFRAAKKQDDYWDYHGHEYPWIGFEELTNWPDPGFYLDIQTCCRSSHPSMPRKLRATANPYGAGHNWVKSRFVDIGPPGTVVREKGKPRVRVHGNIYENKYLIENDPEYIKTIENISDPNKRRAWLHGDWDIVAGGAVDDVWDRNVHVIKPFAIPENWRIDRSFDWGSSKPFSVGWWAEASGEEVTLADGSTWSPPKGTLFRIHEYYGWNGEPNQGCKKLAVEIAEEIKKIEKRNGFKNVKPGPADSSIFDAENGVCIADDMKKRGVKWTKADKSPGSRVNGLEALRKMLKAGLKRPMEEPGLFVFDTCTHFIRTVPVLPRDAKKPDDVDTDAEDHVYDEARYRCMQVKTSVKPFAPMG